MKILRYLVLISLFLPLLCQARPAEQDRRIEYLLAALRGLDHAQFVRNGSAYDSKAAEDHLRMKLDRAGERVQTAEQFIDGIASKSLFTGQPYQIRFKDGKAVDAGTFLHEKLKEFPSH